MRVESTSLSKMAISSCLCHISRVLGEWLTGAIGAQDLEVFVQADGDEMGVGGAQPLFEVGQTLHHGDVVVAVDGVITVHPLEVFAGVLLPRLCACWNVYISDA